MKKQTILLPIAIMALLMIFFACDKETGGVSNVIEVKNIENSDEKIKTVKAIMPDFTWSGDDVVLATCDYENEGFRMELPKTVDNKYLMRINQNGIPAGIKISDKKAKMMPLRLCAFGNDVQELGEFFSVGINATNYVLAIYYFADRNFTMKGKMSFFDMNIEYACSLAKGWNIIYSVMVEIEEGSWETSLVTTTKPKNIEMKWSLEIDDYWQEKIASSNLFFLQTEKAE